MQNKGIVKFIAIALVLVCCFYLSFSFVTSHYESKIAKIAETQGQEAAQAYQDSVETNKVWLWAWNLKECREMEMGLGLDLKGGLNVIMEVSVPDIVDMLAAHKQDADYLNVLDQAKKEEQQSQGDFVDIFCDQWEKTVPNRQLREVFATQQLREKVNNQTSNSDVRKALKEEVASAIENAENVVRNRVDKFGVVQPNIQRLEGQSRIMVELPGVKDKNRILKLLESSANLEFWETFSAEEVVPSVQALLTAYAQQGGDVKATEEVKAEDSLTVAQAEQAPEEVAPAQQDTAKVQGELAAEVAAQKEQTAQPQVNGVKMPRLNLYPRGNAIIGHASVHDTAAVNRILQSELAAKMLRKDLKLLWGAKSSGPIYQGEKGEQFQLYAIKVTDPSGKAPLEGDVITSASDGYDQLGKPDVSMQMNAEGTRIWADMTRKNVDKAIAIVLDDVVYSAPNVNNEINGGSSQITGNFTIEDTKDLANTLNSGKMPAPMRILSSTMVGPSLGAKSIQQGII